jgi:hypothetical protein
MSIRSVHSSPPSHNAPGGVFAVDTSAKELYVQMEYPRGTDWVKIGPVAGGGGDDTHMDRLAETTTNFTTTYANVTGISFELEPGWYEMDAHLLISTGSSNVQADLRFVLTGASSPAGNLEWRRLPDDQSMGFAGVQFARRTLTQAVLTGLNAQGNDTIARVTGQFQVGEAEDTPVLTLQVRTTLGPPTGGHGGVQANSRVTLRKLNLPT